MVLARALLVSLLLGAPGIATAWDLNLAGETSVQYDSNVLREEDDKDEDVTFRFGPIIRVDSEDRRLDWSLEYRPVYQKYVEYHDLDQLAHFAYGSARYDLTNRTRIEAFERFSYSQSVNGASSDGGDSNIESRRSDITQNSARVSVSHNFSPRWIGQLALTNEYFDSDLSSTPTNLVYSSIASVNYALSARDRVGGGTGFTYQTFDEAGTTPASESYTYRFFASWLRQFNEDTELSVRIGPALIDNRTDTRDSSITTIQTPFVNFGPNALFPTGGILIPNQAACVNSGNCQPSLAIANGTPAQMAISSQAAAPLFFGTSPDEDDDLRVTVFGETSLTHRWTPKISSALSYSRSDNSASSLGTTTIADRVSLSNDYNPTRRWNFNLRGDWIQRKSTNDVSQTVFIYSPVTIGGVPTAQRTGLASRTVDNSIDTTYWSVSGRAAYRVTRRGTVTLRVTYQHQDNKSGSLTDDSSFQNVIGFLGFRYDLEPFQF